MQTQTMILTNSASHLPFYTSYHTPPYTFTYNGSWPETAVYQPFSMNEDVLQMQQQLRFPTPPITPPRSFNSTTAELAYSKQPAKESDNNSSKAQQQRTQSVIMKIGYDQNPQYLTANLEYDNFKTDSQNPHEQNHNQLLSHNDTHSSGTSSPTSQNEFICDWLECGRYFESLELLAHHVTLIHAVAALNDGLYYCRWTGCQRTERGFNARYKMLVHVRTHTKEKPHQCHLCDKRFSRAENLKIHIRSHSGEKPYICTFEGCNKAYSNSSDRFKHTRTHSMEKPYMCKVPGCQKRYTDPSSLRKHVKTFKHSTQILDSNTAANVLQSSTINNSPDESHVPYPIEVNHKYQSYFPVLRESSATATPQDSFCLALEKMCHMKASHNCYAGITSALSEEKSHWSHREAKTEDTLYFHHSSLCQQNTSCDMQLEFTTEKPLDLRVKRA